MTTWLIVIVAALTLLNAALVMLVITRPRANDNLIIGGTTEPVYRGPVIGYWYDINDVVMATFFKGHPEVPLKPGTIVPGRMNYEWGEIRGNLPTEAPSVTMLNIRGEGHADGCAKTGCVGDCRKVQP